MFGLDSLLDWIRDLAVDAVNGLIYALGTVLGGLVALLPQMPELPQLPEPMQTTVGWVAWFFPVGTALDVLIFVLAAWLIWQIVALALRWAKGLGE